jgi:hypothetical protein
MRSNLLSVQSELGEVRTIIDAQLLAEGLYPSLLRLPATHQGIIEVASQVGASRTVRSKYQYISVIIALYGAMEQFIESVVTSYLRIVPRVCRRFDNVPEVIRVKHHDLSIEYLSAIKSNRVHNPEDTSLVVERLARCKSRVSKYEFNHRAFTLRNANMSFDRMQKAFANIGVEVTARRLVNTTSFRQYYLDKNGVEANLTEDAQVRRAFAEVDELVERRNRVAHGANNVDEIEGPSLLLDRVCYVGMYCSAIYEIVEDSLLRMCMGNEHVRSLGVPVRKFGASIVCFPLNDGQVTVGDCMYMLPSDPNVPAVRGLIDSIQVNNNSVVSVVGSAGLTFGARVPYRASSTASYGLLSSDMAAQLDA